MIAPLSVILMAAAPSDLPVGPRAPIVIPQAPKPHWSWDRVPRSFHGAVKDRDFNEAEVARLAQFQMVTIEKWYTPCGSHGPVQNSPACAEETRIEALVKRIKRISPNITSNLYWNSMFDFSFYAAHLRMIDLEARGIKAYLRDDTGAVIELCNDGNAYCNITTYNWAEPLVRALWVEAVTNATAAGIDGIFADHSANEGTNIGAPIGGQGPNQLCNGKGAGRLCYNFTSEFRDTFNSWHLWATNFTQDLLSRTTGGPVIQGPLASMNNATWDPDPRRLIDANFCDFDSLRRARASPMGRQGAIFEARGPCSPSESCVAAYLAAVTPGTYMHCTYNGDDLVGNTGFPGMNSPLGEPAGDAVETPAGSDIWIREFASGTKATWNNAKRRGSVQWGSPRGSQPTL